MLFSFHSTAICLALAATAPSIAAHPTLSERYVFNADEQRVSTSGIHAWEPPKALQMRGPCPGLNALANHGYISRNGITNLPQVIAGMQQAYGVSPDFGAVIAVLGASQAGDGFTFSIGGPPPANLIGGILLGQPGGLDNSHNHFEGDCSITRDDLYETGNDVTLNINFFKQLMDLNVDNYDLTVLGHNAAKRFEYCVSHNPYFFRGIAGTAVPPGTNGLVAHLMSNKSAEYPGGRLNATGLMSFFGVSNETGEYVYHQGHERIPPNFYKWNPLNEYNTANFAADVAQVFVQNPKTIAVGGNTGSVNSFVGLNVGDVTGGVYNSENLLKGNNLACFLFQATESLMPDLLRNAGILRDIEGVMSNVTNTLAPQLAAIGCPKLKKVVDTPLGVYPGWTKMDADGTYTGKLQGTRGRK